MSGAPVDESTPIGPDEDVDLERALAALEALVVDNRDLAELEQRLAGFNLFEALGNVRREERHSDFLAFLLDPMQPHGLDASFLRSFIDEALARDAEASSPLRRIDVALFDLTEARVEREWNSIDILVTSEADRFVLLVENKVDTDEHSDQLRRYLNIVRARFRGWSILPVFLTRDGHAPSHDAYHPLDYGGVRDILRRILDRQRASLPTDVEVAVRHYVEMLERHLLDDTPIADLARRIYARHRRALDIVFEHRPDAQEQLREHILALLESYEDLRVVRSTKAYTHFIPTAWDAYPELRSGGDGTWMKAPDLLRFEIKQTNGLSLHLIIGPGDESLRQRLYDAAGSEGHGNLFGVRRKSGLAAKFTQLWRRLNIVSRKDATRLPVEDQATKLAEAFEAFHKTTLPKLTAVFVDLLAPASDG